MNHLLHKKNILTLLISAATSTVMMGLPGAALGMGLGEIRTLSPIGAPFAAEVEVSLNDVREFDSVLVKSASPSEYVKSGMPYTPFLENMKVRVFERAGRVYGLIQSSYVPYEPVVNLILEGSTPTGKISRAYSLALSPNMERRSFQQPAPTAVQNQNMGPSSLSAQAPNYVPAVTPTAQQNIIVAPAPVPAQRTMIVRPKPSPQKVIEVGVRPKDIEFVTGHGEKMPLTKALSLIVPAGWRGFAADSAVKVAQPVTWSASKEPWTGLLGSVLSGYNIRATIHWSKKEVEFSLIPDKLSLSEGEEEVTLTQAPGENAVSTISMAPAVRFERPVITHVAMPAQPQTMKPIIDENKVLSGLRAVSVEGKGSSSAAEKTIHSFGVNVGFMSAMNEIIPPGWMLVSGDVSVADVKMVGWNGRDRSWLAVLDEILNVNRLGAKMNRERREIEIFRIG